MSDDKLKYPIGKFQRPEVYTPDVLNLLVKEIEIFPSLLRKETQTLSNEQLDTPYRSDGWTIRQVVHHCADSHMNSLIRFKLALTEERPTIKPYFEDRWAKLSDSKIQIEASLKMLEGIHTRWVTLLNALSEGDFARIFIHPEHGREMRLYEATALYAWHGKHHLAHITSLKEREKW